MAEKRMFSKSIIDSDVFVRMPISAQALYFHLAMRADDEGFIDKPKGIMELIGANDDDILILLNKRYLLAFDSGIVVIKHWWIHNWIRQNRIKPTNYQEELETLKLQKNKAYTEKNKSCQSNVSQMSDTFLPSMSDKCQPRREENILEENRIDKSIYSQLENTKKNMLANANTNALFKADSFVEFFNTTCPTLPNIKIMTDKRKKSLNSLIKKYDKKTIKNVLRKAEESDFLSGRNGKWTGCNIDWLINPTNFVKVLEGNYDNNRNKESEDTKINREFKKAYIQKNTPKSKLVKESFDTLNQWINKFDKKRIDADNKIQQ